MYSVYIINLNYAFNWDKKGDKRPNRGDSRGHY